jgi:hypothetical protein
MGVLRNENQSKHFFPPVISIGIIMIINLSFIGNVKEKPKSVDRLMKFISKDSNFSRDLFMFSTVNIRCGQIEKKKKKRKF